MLSLRLRTKVFIFFLVTSSVILILTYASILREIGHFLVYEQKPRKADLIYVLNGRDTERSLAAVDLYHSGYASLIVIPRGNSQPASADFWNRVGTDFYRQTFFERAIEAMNIPKDSFLIIGQGVSSTYDEACVLKAFAIENGIKNVLLVTSKWHSKRAYLTFKSVMARDSAVEIILHPSKYDSFDPDSWWKNENDAELVFGEYTKLLFYILTSKISLSECMS